MLRIPGVMSLRDPGPVSPLPVVTASDPVQCRVTLGWSHGHGGHRKHGWIFFQKILIFPHSCVNAWFQNCLIDPKQYFLVKILPARA